MFVVTFYSYKGGVGRTLALVNTAFRLASRGKTVFILDFDLEAPGVDSFVLFRDRQPRQGIVEYISQFTADEKVEPLPRFVFEIDPAKTQPGKVLFMGAGRKDDNYQFLLSGLDWKYFYRRKQGFLFVENLKAAIEKEYAPDYVLVDSRTGLTDISGICTLQLPNLVVLLFNLNNQNVVGISKIYHSIRFNKINKEIKTLLVASPIPDVPDFIGVRKDRLEYGKKTIGAEQIDLILPFDPFVAFEETVLSAGMSKTYLSESYDSLCRLIIRANKSDVLTMLEEARRLTEQGNLEAAELEYQELIESNANNPKACLDYGRFLRMSGKNKEALDYFRKAHELNPNDPEPLGQLITAHLASGHREEALGYLEPFLACSSDARRIGEIADALEFFGDLGGAMRAFERALELSDELEFHLGKGNIYMRMGKPAQAIPHYMRAAEGAPSGLPFVYNCGYALSLLGDQRATEYFQRAVALFEQSNMSGESPGIKANQHQAMSHAYVGLGEMEKARTALGKALEVARRMPPNRRIFSSVQYKRVPAKEFIEETTHLLKKTDKRPD